MTEPIDRRSVLRRTASASIGALALTAGGLSVASAASAAPTTRQAAEAKRIVYVEVNDNDMANAADYTLQGTNRPAFDIAIIFAANINYDSGSGSAYLHLNERVTETLSDAANQIRPLQQRGIKVLLSILGNHQPAGIANFPSRETAAAFADELAAVVSDYGLDGIDFDDEYSNYNGGGNGPANASSFVYLVDELRDRLGPDKLITFYKIGPAAGATEYGGIRAGDILDYSWNPWYGQWSVPSVTGMDDSQLAPGAIDLTQTSSGTAANFANRTVNEGYGAIITYNLVAGNHASYISGITKPLTGLDTVHDPH
ncbi:endo-beta-N-acetylglucosaminidase H [Glycomyces sp. NPDC046736]|uniref:endo-beta-N-acetylglucosaminidase H n=1 Tax=Glycomyces sp. NPDC046736 TaxID=3155615 RepID=UPI00340DBD65